MDLPPTSLHSHTGESGNPAAVVPAVLVQFKVQRFVLGYSHGMHQPAVVVSLDLTRSEVKSMVLKKFDDIFARLKPSQDRNNDIANAIGTLNKNPLISRLLRLTLFILQQMGMPLMGGCKELRRNADNPRQWLVALPALTRANEARQASFALACALVFDLDKGVTVDAKAVAVEINKVVQRFRKMAPGGVNTLSFLHAAHEMGVPWLHIANNVYQFG